MKYTPTLARLIDALHCLPGVGPKSAQRMAFYLLERDRDGGRALAQSLSEALPPGTVLVDRDRSMSDRMKGRPGQVTKIVVRLDDQVLSLSVQRGQPAAEICREVRGVVLSRQPVAVQEWAAELARALVGYAEQNARTAEALRRLVTGG